MENKRKIIEIYVTENEDDTTSFNIKEVEDSPIANSTMKMLIYMFSKYDNVEMEISSVNEEKSKGVR